MANLRILTRFCYNNDMGDLLVEDAPAAPPTVLPDWTQEALKKSSSGYTSTPDTPTGKNIATPNLGIYGSTESWGEFFPEDGSLDQKLKRATIISALAEDAKDAGQTIIMITPSDIQADAPYESRSLGADLADKEPPGLSVTEKFRQTAKEAGLVVSEDRLAEIVRGISSVPGAAAALSIDNLNLRALKDGDFEDIINAPPDRCIVTLPTEKGIMPALHPSGFSILGGIGQYSNYAPIYDLDANGIPTGLDPKSDMLLYTGFHEIDHCTNMEDSQKNPFPEYNSDKHAATKYAEAYGNKLASDATVPYFIRTLRAESTVLDREGELDKYVLNGIVPLPGEGAPLSPADQNIAAEQIKDFREELYKNTGIDKDKMGDPIQFSENRYALYHETERMLRTGELDNRSYAKALAENFIDGVERYQPETYHVAAENVISDYPQLPLESYGLSSPAPLPKIPNFNLQPLQPLNP